MRKTKALVMTFLVAVLLCMTNYVFAGTDEVGIFLTGDAAGWNGGPKGASYAALIFDKLGYRNVRGSGYYTVNTKAEVLDYIRNGSKHYGFYYNGHAYSNGMNVNSQTNGADAILYNEITGNWHLVFLDGCSTAATDQLANAFKIVGYSNRLFIGWYKTVNSYDAGEWNEAFYNHVGTTNLRSAALAAVDDVINLNTPIRMYGDKNWYGWAW